MTEQQWLTSSSPGPMLAFLEGKLSQRRLRLFAAGCAEGTGYSDWSAWAEKTDTSLGEFSPQEGAAYWVGRKVGQHHPMRLTQDQKATRAALLRDIAGNPFRPWGKTRCSECDGTGEYELLLVGNGTAPCPECDGKGWKDDWETELCLEDCLRWQDGIIPRLAHALYEDRAFECMPILADALEEAGCTSKGILDHCRGSVHKYQDNAVAYCYTDTSGSQLTPEYAVQAHQHVRGCWVVDLVLGRKR